MCSTDVSMKTGGYTALLWRVDNYSTPFPFWSPIHEYTFVNGKRRTFLPQTSFIVFRHTFRILFCYHVVPTQWLQTSSGSVPSPVSTRQGATWVAWSAVNEAWVVASTWTGGAFRTSPAISLHIEANEMPLDLRRRKLASHYCLKVSSMVTNPARSCIFNKQFVKFFNKNPKIRPLGFRVSGDLSDIGFVQKDIQLSSLSSAPPWLLSSSSVDFSLTALSKSDTSPEIFQSKFFGGLWGSTRPLPCLHRWI